MKNKLKISLIFSLISFILFIVIIILVKNVDVKEIGEGGTFIGLATINEKVFKLFGVNMVWYTITDWMGFIPIIIAAIFAIMGLVQLIKRKNILKVDKNILLLGVYYLLIIGIYLFFEIFIVNYRPIILANNPEASFPSSHTMLVLSIMSTAIIQFNYYLKNNVIKNILKYFSITVMVVTVVGRTISGVHWFTDIIAGILLSIFLFLIYYYILNKIELKEKSVNKDN